MVLVLNEINMLWYVTLKFIIQFGCERVIQWFVFIGYRRIGCVYLDKKRASERVKCIKQFTCVLFVRYFAQPHTKYNILIVDFSFLTQKWVDRVKLLDFRVSFSLHVPNLCLVDYIATPSHSLCTRSTLPQPPISIAYVSIYLLLFANIENLFLLISLIFATTECDGRKSECIHFINYIKWKL